MSVQSNNGLDGLYQHIMGNAHLEEFEVAKNSSALGAVSFVELDKPIRQRVNTVLENLNDVARQKAHFMLDVCTLNLLRKGASIAQSRMIAVDVHYSTLRKTAFRSRYLVVLADLVKNGDRKIMLNITHVPIEVPPTMFCDLLRYLIPIIKNVAVQVSMEHIFTQDLTKLSTDYFVLSVWEITRINRSSRRDIVLGRLSNLPKYGKKIIIRNATQVAHTQPDEAIYL